MERLIRFVKENFAAGRTFDNVTRLNAAALEWCVNGKVFYRQHGKDSFPNDGKQIYLGPGKHFSL